MKKHTLIKAPLRLIALLALFCCTALSAQQITVKGLVTDKSGEPLIGASVLEEGTSNGTVTNFDGIFELRVQSNSKLHISYVGYEDNTVDVKGRTNIQVVLEETNTMLGEVVAIGYGSQKKKEVTGSVASIKSEGFNEGAKTNPVGLIQGKVAGLNIIKTSSDPTSTGYEVQIRGFSTLDKGAGTSPLYIVDGIPVNSIDNISPDEIESMDVLKDGSAAAIYGTRGTNGVIIITTKRSNSFSEKATTSVDFSAYVSTSFRNGDNGMATASEFVNLESYSNGAVIPVLYSDADGNTYQTDWMGALTRKAAITQNYNLAIAGSSKAFNYRASLNYKDAEGIAKNSEREEFIGRFTANQTALNGWLDLQYDMSYMHYRNDYFCGDFKQAAIMNPTYPIYDSANENGYFRPSGTGLSNPVENMNQKESYQNGNYFRGSVRGTINILPVPGLKVTGFAAIEEGNNYNYWYNKTINTDETSSGKAGRSTSTNYNKLFEVTGEYSGQFGKSSIVGIVGFSYQDFLYDGSNIENKGFPTDDAKYYQIGNGDATKKYLVASSYRNSNILIASFARAIYNYDDRYLLSASVRYEGSSRFGANNKWGWFPAVSAGWRLSNEEFMKDQDWCNDLKLRVGFGVTGNNLASDLRSVAMLSNMGTFWSNGQWVYTYGVSQNVNEDLRWEKKYEYNVGIDYSFINSRLYGAIDLYYRQTRDLLWDYDVPTPPYQYSTLLANAGQMDSYGLEIALTGVVVKTRNWEWATTPTVAFNRNYITKLSDASKGFNYKQTTSGGVGENGIMNTNTQILIEGESVGAWYGYKFAGFKDDGTWMFETPSGGYTSEPTESQRMVLGSAQPLVTFGWNNMIRYKNFDLSLFFRGVAGNKILNVTRWAYGPNQPSSPGLATESMNVFMADVADGVYTNKRYFSDYYLEDGSYVKLDNVTLGYNFNLKPNKYVQNLRLYVSAQNLFTITGYSGMDPEVNTTSVTTPGIDYPTFYPTVASVMFGINMTMF